MDDDLILQVMSNVAGRIETLRDHLETCELENLRHLQGQITANRETCLVLREMRANWLGDPEDPERATRLEQVLDRAEQEQGDPLV